MKNIEQEFCNITHL